MIKKIIKIICSSENPFLKFIGDLIRFPVIFFQYVLFSFQKDKKTVDLIKKIRKEKNSPMYPSEMAQVCFLTVYAMNLSGDFAEVGVYTGGSAKLICENKGNKNLHLFDTFRGFPKLGSKDDAILDKKIFSADLDEVKVYLKNYKNVFFHEGVFPDTAKFAENIRFSFVHLDVDLYKSTLEGLKFFYPRMVEKGVILVHDFSNLKGVRSAVNEFTDKSIELSTSQCIIIK